MEGMTLLFILGGIGVAILGWFLVRNIVDSASRP
jgi:hypothetical protein